MFRQPDRNLLAFAGAKTVAVDRAVPVEAYVSGSGLETVHWY